MIMLLVIATMLGCKKTSDKQVKDHEPISESEYQAILDMEILDDGPLKQDKLIASNEINYYTLTSSTGRNLYSEIMEKGPSSPNCENCAWSYRWDFIWKWDINESGGQCSVKWINAKVWFSYNIPLWVREQEVSFPFRQRYSEWMRDVWSRINKRTVIVLQETALLERNLMELPRQNCAELDRRIKTAGPLTSARINTRIEAVAKGGARDWMFDF